MTVAILASAAVAVALLVVLVVQASIARVTLQDANRRLMIQASERSAEEQEEAEGSEGGAKAAPRGRVVRVYSLLVKGASGANMPPAPTDIEAMWPMVCSNDDTVQRVSGRYTDTAWLLAQPNNDGERLWNDVARGEVSYLILADQLLRVFLRAPSKPSGASGSSGETKYLVVAPMVPSAMTAGPAGCAWLTPLPPILTNNNSYWTTLKKELRDGSTGLKGGTAMQMWGF